MRLLDAKKVLHGYIAETYGIQENDYVPLQIVTSGTEEQAAVVEISIAGQKLPKAECKLATDLFRAIIAELEPEVTEAYRTIMNYHMLKWLDADKIRDEPTKTR